MLYNIAFSNNLFVLCVLLGLLFTLILYYSKRSYLKKSTFFVVSIFRFALITILLFLLIDPVVKTVNKVIEKPIVVVLQDASSSVKENTFNQLNNFVNDLDGFDVYKYNFSDNLYDNFTESNNGKFTDISKAFDQISSSFANRNLSSVVIASDGLINSGVNPLYNNNINVPIHTICLGDTNYYSDNLISDVKHNDIVFLGNSFQSEIYIESNKYKGKKITLLLKNNGKTFYDEEIEIKSNNQFFKILVEIPTTEIGVQLYTAELVPIEGEKNTENNLYKFYVDVVENKYNILLVHDGSHPDIASFVNVINQNKDFNLDVMKSKEFNFNEDEYNLLIIHSISKENTEFIKKIKSLENLPILIFCKQDFKFYSELIPNVDFIKKSNNSEVFSSVNNDFLNFNFSEKLTDLIDNSTPITTAFGIFNLSNNIEVAINQKIGNTISDLPILLFDENNGRKIGVIFGEGFWRWKLKDYRLNKNNESFNEFYNSISQYLILKDDKSKFRLFYDKEINENQEIIFKAQVYDDNFKLDNKYDIKLVLTDSKNKEYEFLFDRNQDQYILNIGNLQADNYELFAKVEKRNLEKFGKISIKEIQLEKLSLVANHQLLYALSQSSGGNSFYPSNFSSLIDLINENQNKNSLLILEDKLKQLIDFEWILLILLSLISLEWLVRKYNGLI